MAEIIQKLWLVRWTGKPDSHDCCYIAAVIAAPDELEARFTHPDGRRSWDRGAWRYRSSDGNVGSEDARHWEWGAPNQLTAREIGTALPGVTGGTVIYDEYYGG